MSTAIPPSDPNVPREPKKRMAPGRWRRVTATIAIGLAIFLVLAVATIAVVLRSPWFHSYAIRTLQKDASARLGTRVQLQSFTLHPISLSVDLYGITVAGAAPYPAPPLLQVQHVAVSVRVVSILQRKWYLDNIRIDRPILKIFFDRHGTSNLPKLKGGGTSHISVFQLAIRHAMLDRGAVYYNDLKIPVEANLHDVNFRSSFDSSLQKYSGALSYADGRLVAGSLQPIPHNLTAQFNATPTVFHLTQATLTSGPSRLVLHATLDNYSHPILAAQYEAMVDGRQVRDILNNPSVPFGLIHAAGSLRYRRVPNRSIVDSLALNGILSSRRLDLHDPKMHARIDNVAAHYAFANGNAIVQNFHARLLSGELKGSAEMTQVGGNSHTTLRVSLQNVSLHDLRQAVRTAALPANLAVGGVLNVQANAAWGRSFDNLVAHADATVSGRISAAHPANGGRRILPVNGVLDGTYKAASKQLMLTRSYFRTPATRLTMDGTISHQSDLTVLFQSKDLGELETIADVLLPASARHAVPELGLAGRASFRGTVRGSTVTPRLTGLLTASDIRVDGTSWRELRTRVDVGPAFASLQHGELQAGSHGHITFDLSTGLKRWAFSKTSPIEASLNVSRLNVSDLMRIARSSIPLTGSLTANVKVHGSELNPEGSGNVSLASATIYDEPVQSAQAFFSATKNTIDAHLDLHLPAGTVESQVSIKPHEQSYIAQLTAQQIHLGQLEALKSRNIDASGTVNLQASGQGTFKNPQIAATLQGDQLKINTVAITRVNLQANLANHIAAATLTSEAADSSIRANAKVNLTGEYMADARIDTQAIPLQPLLARYAPSQAAALNGETELHATLHGPLKDRKFLQAHIVIPTLRLAYGEKIQLAAVSPIHVDYTQGVLALQRAQIRGTDTDLQLQGSIPVNGKAPPSLMLQGTVNLKLAQLLNTSLRSSGELKLNISTHASPGSDLGGQIQVVDANFTGDSWPVGLQHGNGVLTLDEHRLNIQKFQGDVGGGTLLAQGGVTYRPHLQFDLGLAFKDVRLLYPQGVRESMNANLRLNGSTQDAVLGGTVNISDISLTPSFELANFITQFSSGVAPPPTPGFSQNLRLNVAVHASNSVNLVSRTLQVSGNANLQLRGTAAQPVILGRVDLRNGDIIFNGNRFVLNGGTIEFVNPSETQPVVNLTLNTTIQEYNISMRFNGPVNALHTNFSSTPSLPSADIIHLLAFGNTTEAGANSPTPANQAAESLVASQVSSQITSRVSRIAGISQLSINPVLAGGTTEGPAGANITIQQRVTGNLFVTFSTNVASTQDQIISGQYQVSPRVALSLTRDPNGGFAIDALINKSW